MSQKFIERSFKEIEAATERAGYRVVDMSPAKKEPPDGVEETGEPKSCPHSAESLFFIDDELDKPSQPSQSSHSQSVCISPEDMMYMIRDNSTGTFYDIRTKDTATLLKQEDLKLTKISTAPKKPWQDWWKKKRRQNFLLLMASEKGDKDTVIDLLSQSKHGDLAADVNAKGLDEFTPLHFAASEGNIDVAEILLKHEAHVDATSSSLRTPLHVACNRGCRQMVELLVKSGANVNAQDKDGNTPAHLLSESGWQDALEELLKTKPDLTIKNIYGETAPEVAANLTIRQMCLKCIKGKQEDSYTRTVVQNVILHNNRADMVKTLFFRAQRLGVAPPAGTTAQEAETANQTAPAPAPPLSPPPPQKEISKPKTRLVKIIEATKRLSKLELEEMKSAAPSSAHKTPVDLEDIEDKIGPDYFDVIQMLGKGSFGEVYLVRYRPTGRIYAMKVLHKRRIMAQNILKYAKAERNVLCLTKHTFIVGLYFAFQTSDKLFLILEYCPGGDLGKVLLNETRITEDRARIYAAEVLLALEDLHKHDIIFRDLKPDNVVLDEEGHALLTDFGLSKEGVMDNLSSKSFCGSVAYLAPEMLKKTGHGKAVDWYLLGVLIYELLVGMPPYFSNTREKLFKNIESAPLKLPLYLSHEVSSLIVALLNRNPQKRLGSGKEDANEIKRHHWFKGIDWDVVIKRGLKPPKPIVKPIPDTLLSPEIFADRSKGEHHIQGWEYVDKNVCIQSD